MTKKAKKRKERTDHGLMLEFKAFDSYQGRYIYAPWRFLAIIVVSAFILLSVILWTVPRAIETVSALFQIEVVRLYFPAYWGAASHEAQNHEGPWDVFCASILMINIAACLTITAVFVFLVLHRPLHLQRRLKVSSATLNASARFAALAFLLSAGMTYFLLCRMIGVPYDQWWRPVPVYLLIVNAIITFLPPTLIWMTFLFKAAFVLRRLRSAT